MVRKIPYKDVILRTLAEQADSTIENLIDAISAMCVSRTESGRRLRKMMNPGYAPAVRVNFFSNLISENAVRVTLSRLKKDGLIKSSERGTWAISTSGKDYLGNKKRNSIKASSLRPDAIKVLVSFDIPEMYREERTWLRQELAECGFIPLQKSVWVGEDALSEEFFREILQRHLEQYVCVLGVRSLGTIKDILANRKIH